MSSIQREKFSPAEIELPWPPSINRYYRTVVLPARWPKRPTARVLISKDGRAYRETVRALVLRQRLPCFDASVRVTIEAHPPDRRVRDLDNILKAALDSLVASRILADDFLVDELIVTRKSVMRGGRIFVRVECL